MRRASAWRAGDKARSPHRAERATSSPARAGRHRVTGSGRRRHKHHRSGYRRRRHNIVCKYSDGCGKLGRPQRGDGRHNRKIYTQTIRTDCPRDINSLSGAAHFAAVIGVTSIPIGTEVGRDAARFWKVEPYSGYFLTGCVSRHRPSIRSSRRSSRSPSGSPGGW